MIAYLTSSSPVCVFVCKRLCLFRVFETVILHVGVYSSQGYTVCGVCVRACVCVFMLVCLFVCVGACVRVSAYQ